MHLIPIREGQSVRLRVTNQSQNRVRISPLGTPLSVYAGGCAPVGAGQLLGR